MYIDESGDVLRRRVLQCPKDNEEDFVGQTLLNRQPMQTFENWGDT